MSVWDCAEERLLLYMGMAYHGYGLRTWYYSPEGELYYTNCPNEKELQTFFYLGGCLDYAISQKSKPPAPFLMSDSIGMVWLGEYVPHPGLEDRFVVFGPAFFGHSSLHNIADSLRKLNLSQSMQRNYLNLLLDMPVVSIQSFQALARMLHYAAGFADASDIELSCQITVPYAENSADSEQLNYESANHREKMLLQCVRDGNQNHGDIIEAMHHYEGWHYVGGDPMRSAKDEGIIFTSRCAQAAMEGGLPARIAKELELEYIRRIERNAASTDLVHTMRRMLDEFIEKVADYNTDHTISPQIRICCAYIKKHMAHPITLKDLAEATGYAEYYLARKFQKEMGIKPLDYIKEIRLDYSKILLSTTNLTVQEICDKLQFGTRNYFTRVFRQRVGMTPTEYRQSAWHGTERKS